MCVGGGVVGGMGGGGANRVWVIPFCAIENEGLHKICNHFLRVMYFFAFQFPSYKIETTKEESITRQILFFIKMTEYQTNIAWC